MYSTNTKLSGIDNLAISGVVMQLCGTLSALYERVNPFKFERYARVPLLVRFFTGAIGSPCYFAAIKYIPVSKANIVTSTNPLWVSLIAYLVLKEPMTCLEVIALFSAFSGVVVIFNSDYSNLYTGDQHMKTVGICLVLVFLVFRVASAITRRKLKNLHYVYAPFYISFGRFLCSLGLIGLTNLPNYEFWTSHDICMI